VKFVCCTTDGTLSTIALPNLQFHRCRNQPATLGIDTDGLGKVFLAFDCDQFEFAHNAKLVSLKPRVDQVKDAVVRPDAWLDFFIDADSLGQSLSRLGCLRGSMEFAVLGGATGRAPHGSSDKLEPFRFGDAKVTTDLPCEMIVDLGVSRHRAALVQRRVMPPRMPSPFAQQSATMSSQMRQQVAALHTAI